MSIKRGQVYYVRSVFTTGSEQWSGRPGIIVSNDLNNANSTVVEVVYMTTKPKADLPTHVPIHSMPRESAALCEQITSVSIERLGDCCGEVTQEEMEAIEGAMMISLGIDEGKLWDAPEGAGEKSEMPLFEPGIAEENAIDIQGEYEDLTVAYQAVKDEVEILKLKLKSAKEMLDEASVAAAEANTERQVIHRMYEDLLNRLLERGGAA